jgi:short-subunit dehydrogenase
LESFLWKKQGFQVVITGRSAERLEKAIDSIKEHVPEAMIEYMVCNQDSLDNVEAFVKAFKQKQLPIHILYH